MKLKNDDKLWCPAGRPEFLCLHPGPPQNLDIFLHLQAEVLARLVAEATPGEVAEANRQLENCLQAEELDFLPSSLLNDPRTSRYLMNNPAVEGGALADWKWAARELLESNPPQMPESEARQEAQELTLEIFMEKFL